MFLLDGLDEIYQELDSDTDMKSFLQQLLRQPRVIITSRSYGITLDDLKPLDLELETVGFRPNKVESYLQKVVRDEKQAKEIWSFIQNHTLIQGLVRIPIQLDALCFIWNGNLLSEEQPRTMTTMLKLWQKDILRLEKQHNGKPMTEHDARTLRDVFQIEELVEEEINLLEGAAFSGLYNEIVEFDAEDRDRIYQQLRRRGMKLPLVFDSTLKKKISFMRTSDDTLEDRERSYHFLHLTFQEFFAARYFVKHWLREKGTDKGTDQGTYQGTYQGRDQGLSCFTLGRRTLKVASMTPWDFLQKEKYNSRYDIMWRFVAGLLQAGWSQMNPSEKPLTRFLQGLEAEPRDLLGPAHQRLVMHCLSELIPSNRQSGVDQQERMEDQLSQWLLFEFDFLSLGVYFLFYNVGVSYTFCSQREFRSIS